MAIKIKEITRHGEARWIRVKCPDCGSSTSEQIFLNKTNEKKMHCVLCQADYIVTWDEADEQITF